MEFRRASLLVVAVVLALALSYKATFQQVVSTKQLDIASQLNGTAERPFVYRVLTPLMIGFTQRALPGAHLPGGLQARVKDVCSVDTLAPCPSLRAFTVVDFFFFFVFLMAVYLSAIDFLTLGTAPLCVTLLAYLLVNAILLRQLSHIYDFGTLMFAALLLLVARKGHDLWFFLVLMLACLNKESMILYAFAYAFVYCDRRSMRRTLVNLGAQLAGFTLIYATLHVLFRHNAGVPFQFHLVRWAEYIGSNMSVANLLLTVLAIVLVFYNFPETPEYLRRFSIVLIPWSILLFVGGGEGELRVLFEVLPLVTLLGSLSILRLVAGHSSSPLVQGPL